MSHFLPIGVDQFSDLCHKRHPIRIPFVIRPSLPPAAETERLNSLLISAGPTVNTSLVFCVLALSSSWTPPSTPDFDPSAIFHRAEPNGLFDEVTATGFDVPVTRTEHDPQWASNTLLAAYNEANFGPKAVPSRGNMRTKTFRFPSLLRAQRDLIIRGQSPALRLADGMRDEEPIRPSFPQTYAQPSRPAPVTPSSPSSQSNPTYQAPYEEQPARQLDTEIQVTPQPFMTAPPPGVSSWGANGAQPYRLGYSLWADIAWLPPRPTDLPDSSKFGVTEFNVGLNHTIPTWWSPWLFSLEHQFNYRSWNGPSIVGDLPPNVYRFGWDMRLETPLNSQFAPFAMTLAFNPSINSDFNQSLGREAVNFDGRGIVFWQADPHLMFALGAGFWDRVKDRVVPYAGVVWLPDDRWEFRIMWPQSRIQYYCGNYMGEDVWLYATGEYHIESYQIGTATSATSVDQIELEDYRILIGLRKSTPIFSAFIEGGWVFGRHVDFRTTSVNDFDTSNGFIGRIGVRF